MYNIPTSIDSRMIMAFWIACLVSAVFAYPVWRLLIRLKSQQNVSAHLASHQAKQGTPTMGGIIIACGALAAFAIQALLTPDDPGVTTPNYGLIALVLFAGFSFIGFADDFIAPRYLGKKRGLGWKEKILMQFGFAALGALMASGWKVDVFAGVAFFLILAFSNAYNFVDGLDGLAGTVLLGLAGGLAGLAWFLNPELFLLMITLMGAAIPFLYLNAPPAKVFMGDVGSLPIGAVIGLTASVLLWSPDIWKLDRNALSVPPPAFNPSIAICLLVVSLIMVAELVPVPMQIFWVKFTKRQYTKKTGQPPDPERDFRLFKFKTPIHHAFEDLPGWKETRVTAVFALTQLLLSLAGITLFVALHWQRGDH